MPTGDINCRDRDVRSLAEPEPDRQVFAKFKHVLRKAAASSAEIALAAPAVLKPASDERDRDPAAVAAAQATANAVAAAAIPPDSDNSAPAFDVARIDSTGEAVIAGRATPDSTVELLRDGELHDRAVADQSGQTSRRPPKL